MNFPFASMRHLHGRCYVGTSIRPTLAGLLARPRFKIGITRRCVRGRWRNIDRSVSGSREFPLFATWGLFPEAMEGTLHSLFRRWRRTFKGSGKTEWFYPPRLLSVPFLLLCALALGAWWLVSVLAVLAVSVGMGAGVVFLILEILAQ
jgi:Flp pilus assembly protein TadB